MLGSTATNSRIERKNWRNEKKGTTRRSSLFAHVKHVLFERVDGFLVVLGVEQVVSLLAALRTGLAAEVELSATASIRRPPINSRNLPRYVSNCCASAHLPRSVWATLLPASRPCRASWGVLAALRGEARGEAV